MSFNVTVTVKDGAATAEVSGTAPDGKLIVHGHADSASTSLGVTQTDANGRQLQSVSSTVYPEA